MRKNRSPPSALHRRSVIDRHQKCVRANFGRRLTISPNWIACIARATSIRLWIGPEPDLRARHRRRGGGKWRDGVETRAAPSPIAARPQPWRASRLNASCVMLSRDSRPGQRIGDALSVEFGDGAVNGLVECGGVGEGLVGEVMGLEVAPDPLDIVEFGGVFGQPFDGEPVCPAGGVSSSDSPHYQAG
jgi:hypothetical protein